MEQDRWIASAWGASENNRRVRFYRLTALGRKQLKAEQENWQKGH
jgi:DNA-binding PadR family transcriptional regulator